MSESTEITLDGPGGRALADLITHYTVKSEPLTYSREGRQSYFRDQIDAAQGDNAARARLERHRDEMAVEVPKLEARAQQRAEAMGFEYRVNPTRLAGQGGNFAPPLWLIEEYATAPTPQRVLARLIAEAGGHFELPQGVQSVNVPRLTTATIAAVSGDGTATPSRDIVDVQVASPVVTISGDVDVALQALDQSPRGAHFDRLMAKDLNAAYDATLETQLFTGTGTGNQFTGLLNLTLPSANTVTYTDASPTATAMFSSLGKMVAAIGNNRRQPPEVWLMTTSRLAWIGTQEDAQSRPLMAANRDGSGKFYMLTIDAELDDAIPTNLGSGTNRDTIVLCIPSDMLLFESAPHVTVDQESQSGTLEARVQLRRYAAFIGGRFPQGVATVQGSGMVVPSGF